MRPIKILFLILLAGFSGFSGILYAHDPVPADALLAPADREFLEKMPAFRKLMKGKSESPVKDKIVYLVARIQISQNEFIRNGIVVKGPRAAYHIMGKYAKRLGIIKTPQDFIDNVASRSNTSGEEYRIRYPDGKEYPVRGILYNELRLVETILSEEPATA